MHQEDGMPPSHAVLLGRIALGTVLGAAIGYERDRHGKHVGLRTHTIVAMASATFMIVSAHFVWFQGYGPGQPVEVDGSRIAASVVSGIGFLAGGAILRTGLTIQGLTTAAGLWLVTAIGLASGGGMYVEALVVTGLGTLVLTVVRRFEDKNDSLPQRRRISLVLTDGLEPLENVTAVITQLGGVAADVQIERRVDEYSGTEIELDVRLPATTTLPELVSNLEALPEVKRIRVQHVS